MVLIALSKKYEKNKLDLQFERKCIFVYNGIAAIFG